MSLHVLSVAYPFAPVSADSAGGAEQVLAALDRSLVARGHRSTVIACEGSRVSGDLVELPLEQGVIDDAMRERAWRRVRNAISTALQSRDIDCVHLHGIDFWAYVPDRAPTLATLHLPLDWYPREAFAPRANVAMHGVSFSQHRTRPPGARLLDPIPNGVDLDRFQARHARRNFALTLGRICPEKGIHLALDAARMAGVDLLVAGRVYPYEAHERYLREEVLPRLGPGRRWIGPADFARKRRLLTAAKCLLIPSLAPETSSLVAMEALACGTPVIAFGAGALPEVVEHGRTGFIVADAQEMAARMRDVEAISREICRATARERFGEGVMVDRYLDVYASLAARARAVA